MRWIAGVALAVGLVGTAPAATVGTIAADPSVIYAGEASGISVSVTLDPGDYLNLGGYEWHGDWFVYSYTINIYDGIGGKFSTFEWHPGGQSIPDWGVVVSYLNPGTFFPYFEVSGFVRMTMTDPTGDCPHAGFCVGFAGIAGTYSTSITVLPSTARALAVPGPIAGAGLPGLILVGIILAWRRRHLPTTDKIEP